MGMDQTVVFAPDRLPPWPRVAELLAGVKHPVQMRMIDGQLAFPDEEPPASWRELRVGTAAGMVSLRREVDGVSLVVWGNAERPLRETWNTLAWALAELTGGRVRTPQGELDAAQFRAAAELPASLTGGKA